MNILGLIIVVLLLVPNIIYAVRNRNQSNRCTNIFMNIAEQIGRYACMFLMVFTEFWYKSTGAFVIYIFGNAILMCAYWVIWILYFRQQTWFKQIGLALIPAFIFLLSGITMRHYLLVVFAVLFGISHFYVASKNKCY